MSTGRAGVLQAAGVRLDDGLGPAVAVGAADDRQVGVQHLEVGPEQRGEARHVDDRIQAGLGGRAPST